jgi:SAM-dependent methyltransferase
LELVVSALEDRSGLVLDVGGGASTLADDLLGRGYRNVGVLDVAGPALHAVRDRLGRSARRVALIVGDAMSAPLAAGSVALWHDRAVFHFLTEAAERRRYLQEVRRCVAPGGLVLVATFAEDGPTRCSGLEVTRYDPARLGSTFGRDFELLESRREEHRTPSGATQPFTYCLFRFGPAV